MSQRIPIFEVPRDLNKVQELRLEITRNSAEISLNFWQEFENIRATQRNRMAGESLRRERINNLMRDGQHEANAEAEALGRSISAQGMITLPSASAAAPPPAAPLMTSLIQEIEKLTPRTNHGLRAVSQKQRFPNFNSKSRKTKADAVNEPPKPSSSSSDEPKLSVIARTPKVSPGSPAYSKSTPKTSRTSRMRLAKKTKK